MASRGNGGKPSEVTFTSKVARFDPVSNVGSASHAGGCSKTEERVCGRVDLEEDAGPRPDLANKMASGRMAKFNVGKPSIFGTSANATKKRKRKSVIESNESSETSNYAEELDLKIQDKSGTSPGDNFRSDANQQLRRSSREVKNSRDDDFVSPPKRWWGQKEGRAHTLQIIAFTFDHFGGLTKSIMNELLLALAPLGRFGGLITCRS